MDDPTTKLWNKEQASIREAALQQEIETLRDDLDRTDQCLHVAEQVADKGKEEIKSLRKDRDEWERAARLNDNTLDKKDKELDTLREVLAIAKEEATTLAVNIHRRHYKEEAPDWEVLETVSGIISQIDNMSAGLAQQIDTLRSQVKAAVTEVGKIGRELGTALARGDEWERRAFTVWKWVDERRRFREAHPEAAKWFEEE